MTLKIVLAVVIGAAVGLLVGGYYDTNSTN